MELRIDIHEPVFAIGIVADKFNISVHTLRLYETEGLILPFKTRSRRRLYSQNDINRIACIRNMIESKGLNIAGIKCLLAMVPCWEILPCSERDRNSCHAYTDATAPCWKIPEKNRGKKCQDVDCRNCHVYKSLSSCDDIKAYVKEKRS